MQDPQEARARERVGALLRGKWKLDALLGVGGMAAVYAATHRNGRRGAVKILHSDISRDKDAQRRFVREGYVANAINHPGVVAVLDDDVSEDGCAFLVMELLRGREIGKLVEQRADLRLTVDEVLFIADEVLGVLEAAHAKGVVHRDLKPENLFLTEEKRLKILDFGIARLRDAAQDGSKTSTGSVMGTPAYMSPEQALGEWNRVDVRSDIWALGATMFELLTGQCVHEAQNLQKMLLAAMTHHARPVQSALPTVPPEVAAIVDRALAFEQGARFQTAESMREAVRAARRAHPHPEFSGFTIASIDGMPAASASLREASIPEPFAPPPTSLVDASSARTLVSEGASTSFAPHHGTLKPSSSDRMRRLPTSSRSPLVAVVGGGLLLAAAVGGYFLYRRSPASSGASSTTASLASETSNAPVATASTFVRAAPGAGESDAAPQGSIVAAPPSAASSVSATPSATQASAPPSPGTAKSGTIATQPPPVRSNVPATPSNTGRTTGTDTKYGL